MPCNILRQAMLNIRPVTPTDAVRPLRANVCAHICALDASRCRIVVSTAIRVDATLRERYVACYFLQITSMHFGRLPDIS